MFALILVEFFIRRIKIIMKSKKIRQLVFAALCLAIGIILPTLIGVRELNIMLSPMHIPVLICGFVCGWMYGGVVGILTPILRSVIFYMPLMYPDAIAMAFELAIYGIVAGLLYKLLPKKIPYIYVSLVSAMLIGRVIFIIARTGMAFVSNVEVAFLTYVTASFVDTIPGIILHIAIIPFIIIGLKAAKLMAND